MKTLAISKTKQKHSNKVALVKYPDHFRVLVQKTNYREGTKWYTKYIKTVPGAPFTGSPGRTYEMTLTDGVREFNKMARDWQLVPDLVANIVAGGK